MAQNIEAPCENFHYLLNLFYLLLYDVDITICVGVQNQYESRKLTAASQNSRNRTAASQNSRNRNMLLQ